MAPKVFLNISKTVQPISTKFYDFQENYIGHHLNEKLGDRSFIVAMVTN